MTTINNKEITELNQYEQQGYLLLEQANGLEIVTVDDLVKANEVMKNCNSLTKEVEEKRKNLTDPVQKRVKDVIAKVKTLLEPTEDAKHVIKTKILAYNAKMEEIRQAEMKKLEDEAKQAKEAQEKADAERLKAEKAQADAEAKALESASEVDKLRIENERIKREFQAEREKAQQAEIAKQQEQENQMKLDAIKANAEASKPKGLRTRRKFDIVDPNAVPRAFCSPNETMIREAIANGAREIEGVKIYSEQSVQ